MNYFYFLITIVLACGVFHNQGLQQYSNEVIRKIKADTDNGVLVCAHRSYHKNAPENSEASVQEAIELGIDMLELDVRMTLDDSIILMHDPTLDRTTDGTGFVKDKTFQELTKLRLVHNSTYTNHAIPLLSKILIMARDSEVILNLDLKDVDFERLLELLERHGMAGKVISFIGDAGKVQEMKLLDSTYAILPLAISEADIVRFDTLLISRLVHLTAASTTSRGMELIEKNNQFSFVNSLGRIDQALANDNTETLDQLLELSPDIVQTDHPIILLNYLREKNLHE